MSADPDRTRQEWDDAVLATGLFAVDPTGLVLQVRAGAGPVRDALLSVLRGALPEHAPIRRCPLGIADDRLLGGIDLAASLSCGRRIAQHGLLAATDGGVLILPMAERLSREAAARLCCVLDHGELLAERDGVAFQDPARLGLLLLDEGVEDEQPPASLLERAAFRVALDGIAATAATPCDMTPRDLAMRVASARAILPRVTCADAIIEALCAAAQVFGIAPLRAPLMALRIARASAALDGRLHVGTDDAAMASRLVLAWRATCLPAAPSRPEPEHVPEPDGECGGSQPEPEGDARPADAASEQILAALGAALPTDLLAHLQAQADPLCASVHGGRTASGCVAGARHGRPLFARAGQPEPGRRLAVVETLRAAAPWQSLRRAASVRQGRPVKRVEVRAGDFRVMHCEQRPRSIAIFLVDASGSAAMHRLAEAKGAIERLLADCYVRRDRVALIAFRGKTAELLLPPTAALARARRSLACLPGGGGTPLASGLDSAVALALSLRGRGETPLLVLLTDGRANITRAGVADRCRATEEAQMSAGLLRVSGVASMLVDISPRPEAKAQALAASMGALYLKLPDPEALSQAVREMAA